MNIFEFFAEIARRIKNFLFGPTFKLSNKREGKYRIRHILNGESTAEYYKGSDFVVLPPLKKAE